MHETLHMPTADGPRVGIDRRVEFLSDPAVYPESTPWVRKHETHMSWVFLTDRHAWKLKKPVRTAFLDFSTPQRRRADCHREIDLNRRLADGVYRGVTTLTQQDDGTLALDGPGEPVDYLVKMRRLPERLTLEHMIQSRTIEDRHVEQLAGRLVDFYQHRKPASIGIAEYVRRLKRVIDENEQTLTEPNHRLKDPRAADIADAQRRFLEREAALLEASLQRGRVVDAHGDLRPEHIFLEDPPIVIDCLEFHDELRVMDVASELSFLALECERLGARALGRRIEWLCLQRLDYHPPAALRRFFRGYHAMTRARIALWHLDDDVDDPIRWRDKARRYIDQAAPIIP